MLYGNYAQVRQQLLFAMKIVWADKKSPKSSRDHVTFIGPYQSELGVEMAAAYLSGAESNRKVLKNLRVIGIAVPFTEADRERLIPPGQLERYANGRRSSSRLPPWGPEPLPN